MSSRARSKSKGRKAQAAPVYPASPSNATRIEMEEHLKWIESKPVPHVTLPFFYDWHVNSLLVVLSVSICAVPFFYGPFASIEQALMKSFPFVCLIFLAVACVAFPHGPFIRPHPLIWRTLFGASILYLLGVVALLFLTTDQVRAFFHMLDPAVGTHFTLPTYADDCTLSFENLYSAMDLFVPAHFFGWVVKSLMIRHRILCWTLSIAWELLEISLIYAVPNFAECWWDQWIMDVLVCNGLGIEVGLYLCNYLEHRRYKWSGVLERAPIVAKIKRAALQFTPESWMHVEWESLSTVTRFVQVQMLLIFLLTGELNAFLLKLNLFIPTSHRWNIYRLVFLTLIAMPAIRQFYLYCVDRRVDRLGSQCVVTILILITETALALKTMDKAAFHPPQRNVNMWIGAGVVYVTTCVILLLRSRNTDRVKSQ